jgi:hypothetical protein
MIATLVPVRYAKDSRQYRLADEPRSTQQRQLRRNQSVQRSRIANGPQIHLSSCELLGVSPPLGREPRQGFKGWGGQAGVNGLMGRLWAIQCSHET